MPAEDNADCGEPICQNGDGGKTLESSARRAISASRSLQIWCFFQELLLCAVEARASESRMPNVSERPQKVRGDVASDGRPRCSPDELQASRTTALEPLRVLTRRSQRVQARQDLFRVLRLTPVFVSELVHTLRDHADVQRGTARPVVTDRYVMPLAIGGRTD